MGHIHTDLSRRFCLNNSQLWRWKILQKFQVWLLLLKSHFPLSLKKKKITENLNSKSKFNPDLACSPLSNKSLRIFPSDFLPLHNCFPTSRSYCQPFSSNIYYFSAGSGWSREGANLWGSERKISHNSIEKTKNCCQKCKLLFCLGGKITLGFKDTLLSRWLHCS